MLPVKHKLMTCKVLFLCHLKANFLKSNICSFKILNTVPSVMKPLLPFQPVEVKQKHHCANDTNFVLVLHISVCQRPYLWQLLQQQCYAYGTSCTLFKIVASNMSGQLWENGMVLLELKQSCANSLCMHISDTLILLWIMILLELFLLNT